MKRLLALFMCLVMCLSMIPAVYAEDIEIVDSDEEIAIIEVTEESEEADTPTEEPEEADTPTEESEEADENEEELILIGDPEIKPIGRDDLLADSSVNYRALLIGEVSFTWETANRNRGDLEQISAMLGNVYGPEGNLYSVTTKTDLSISGIENAISTTFAKADSNDVSLFFIATHGVVDIESGEYAGMLLTIEEPGESEGYLLLEDLATWLKAVPGKVIVVLGSCGSGAAIYENSTITLDPDEDSKADARFTEAVVHWFEQADEHIYEPGVSETQTGEFLNNKFYVLTAAAHQESSWGQESSDPYNYFPYYFAQGANTGMPADSNGDKVVTLNEMYNYCYDNSLGPYYDGSDYYYQHVQVYPAGSSYKLFSAKTDVKPTITTQPKSVTTTAGTTVTFTVAAAGAESYQWQYYNTDRSEWRDITSTNYSGVQSAKMYVPATPFKNGMKYRCVVSNSVGKTYTNTVVLHVKPGITTQPKSVTTEVGKTASFTLEAEGAESFQWQYYSTSSSSWVNITSTNYTGVKTATMKVPATTSKNGLKFRCAVTNSAGTTYTNTVVLHVKPSITTQPKSVTTTDGKTVTFTVKAEGATSYQWQYYSTTYSEWRNVTNTSYSGLQSATMYVPATISRHGLKYRCAVTNSAGTTYSNAATLYVKPVITTQPKSVTVAPGSKATFKVVAEGATSYQWQYYDTSTGSWANLTNSAYTGLQSATMTVSATTSRNGLKYRCAVKNSAGTVYSNTAILKVKPGITTQPKSVTVAAGSTATFKVVASGATSYQWQYYSTSSSKWVNITSTNYSGVKTATMKVPATVTKNGLKYRCAVTNSAGTTYTNSAVLHVKPGITTQPKSVTTTVGKTATFTVVASGATSYQWQYYSTTSGQWVSIVNSNYKGTETAKMSVPATPERDGMKYRCAITNSAGTVYTSTVTLTVK